MTDIVLVPVTGSSNITAMNNNFSKVQDSINSNVLHTDGGSNTMFQDLDMNGNDILNLNTDVSNPSSILTVSAGDARYYNVNGDTLTGPMNVNGFALTGLAEAVLSTQPVRKQEFDAAIFDSAIQLRSDLSNPLDQSKGSTLVAGSGKIVDPRDFGAHATTEPGFSTFDSTVAFDAAIRFAIDNNLPVVEFQGQYLIDTALYSFELPRDDGTVYPAWVGAGDTNLTAEPAITMPVCLKIDGRVTLRGKNAQKDSISGSWNVASSPIDVNQKIPLLITSGSKYEGTIRYNLVDFTINNYMIGRVIEGTAEESYEQLNFNGCGITGLFQGIERCSQGRMRAANCLTGDVYGGWWLQRNSTALQAAYLPPYPATDVWSLGWTDVHHTDTLVYSQALQVWGVRHISLDSFFDMYFYKSANSARTSAGGRLSNNDAPTPAVTFPYYGIVGRARTVFSRYGRAIANFTIREPKTLGCHRTAIFYGPGAGGLVLNCKIDTAYIERSGLIDPSINSTTSNRFGIDNLDPYRAAGYGIGLSASYGGVVGTVTGSSANQKAPTTDGAADVVYAPIGVVKITYAGTPVTSSDIFLDFTEFGDSFVRKYRARSDFFFTQPLRFGSESGENFTYSSGTFTPTLTSGGVAVPASVKEGSYKIIGKTLFFRVAIFHATKLTYTAGDMVISGLPVAAGTGVLNGAILQGRGLVGLTAGITVGGTISGTTITLTKDSAGTKLSGADVNGAGANTYVEVCGSYMIV